jgi:hypothetical protein
VLFSVLSLAFVPASLEKEVGAADECFGGLGVREPQSHQALVFLHQVVNISLRLGGAAYFAHVFKADVLWLGFVFVLANAAWQGVAMGGVTDPKAPVGFRALFVLIHLLSGVGLVAVGAGGQLAVPPAGPIFPTFVYHQLAPWLLGALQMACFLVPAFVAEPWPEAQTAAAWLACIHCATSLVVYGKEWDRWEMATYGEDYDPARGYGRTWRWTDTGEALTADENQLRLKAKGPEQQLRHPRKPGAPPAVEDTDYTHQYDYEWKDTGEAFTAADHKAEMADRHLALAAGHIVVYTTRGGMFLHPRGKPLLFLRRWLVACGWCKPATKTEAPQATSV